MDHHHNTMYIRISLIIWIFSILGLSEQIFAATTQTYTEYKKQSNTFCEDPKRDWHEWSNLVGFIDYPELNDTIINQTMASWRVKKEWNIWSEKNRLLEDLDPSRIGDYSGFKTLEIARTGYRSNMNSLFACAVVASRIQTVDTLQTIIKEKVTSKNSEILEKLKREANNLKETQSKLLCNPDMDNSKEIISKLANSSTKQYCYYRHYLDYLNSNIINNLHSVLEVEKNIWQWSGTIIPKNTEEWAQISPIYYRDISREINKSNKVLPKAIASFWEMDQTYGAHILLVIIYDDYIRLRKALSTYMNLSSQIYQKAYNAQSTNK